MQWKHGGQRKIHRVRRSAMEHRSSASEKSVQKAFSLHLVALFSKESLGTGECRRWNVPNRLA